MADEYHLQQIRMGPISWNQWRIEVGWETVMDLSESDLAGFNFTAFALHDCDFSKADLTEAVFSDDYSGQDSLERNEDLRQQRLVGVDC